MQIPTPVRFHTIHLFVLLPEPLDLPSGLAIQREDRPGTYTGESFRMWDGTELTADDLQSGPICRFFHRQTSFDFNRTQAAISLAHWAWPSLGMGEEKPQDEDDAAPLEDADAAQLEDTEAAPKEGAGAAQLEDTDARPGPKMQTAAELIHVVGCAEPDCRGEVGEEFHESALQEGLRMVQDLQRAVYTITRQPYTLLTKASAAFATPVAIGTISNDEFEPPRKMQFWQTNWNLLSELPPADLSDDDFDAISHLLQHINDRLFLGYLDFQREAVVAHQTRGDNRGAAIFMGLACERLLDDLLCHLMWEDEETPEAGPDVFQDRNGIAARVRREFHPRLKGSWSTKDAGPLADWWEKVAHVRNKVAHGTYIPTDEEIEDGIGAANRLVAYISDCLVDQIKQEGRYRLTALALMGEPGMRQRGIWTRRSKDAAKRFDDENLWALASRWKAAAERQRETDFGGPILPDESRAYVMYVIQAQGPSYWVQHDRVSKQARTLGQPPDLTATQQQSLSKLEPGIRSELGPGEAQAMGFVVDQPTAAAILSDWQEEYHLIPGAEVMINGSDRASMAYHRPA